MVHSRSYVPRSTRYAMSPFREWGTQFSITSRSISIVFVSGERYKYLAGVARSLPVDFHNRYNRRRLEILTMPPRTTGKCAVCSKEATLVCPRCSEGLDVSGRPSQVFYCSKTCQGADWKEHKDKACKHANARKKLFRGAALIQGLLEACWEMRSVVRREVFEFTDDGKLGLHQDWISKISVEVLPVRECITQDKLRQALLSWSECSGSMLWGCGLILELVKGIEMISNPISDERADVFARRYSQARGRPQRPGGRHSRLRRKDARHTLPVQRPSTHGRRHET